MNSNKPKRIGVLGLQGDYAAHTRSLRAAFPDAAELELLDVRRVRQLEDVDGLVMPGGESTTLLKLMEFEPWFDSLERFVATGGAILGTCAGAILLSRVVLEPAQKSLGLIDATIRRNGFGRQIDSFEAHVPVEGWDTALHAAFIRAPRFEQVGKEVEVLARWGDEPVLIRQGRVIAGTFHPELTQDVRLHRWFVDQVVQPRKDDASSTKTPVDSVAEVGSLQ